MNNITGYPSKDKPWLKYYDPKLISEQIPNCSLYEYMFLNNKDYLDNTAINYFGAKITYSELFSMIDVAAKSFVSQGVKPGDVVTIVTISCVNSVVCFYALNKIGAVSNFVNVLSNEEDIAKYVSEFDSKIIVSLDLFANKVLSAIQNTSFKKIIVYSLSYKMPTLTKLGFGIKTRKMDKSYKKNSVAILWDDFISNAANNELHEKKCPQDICYIGHTGGTTGFPKSVLLSNHSFNSVAWQYVMKFERDRKDVFLSVMVPFVTYGSIINIHMPLCLGMELAIIPKFEAKDWSNYIKKYKPVHLCAIPAYVAQLADDSKVDKMDLSMLKTVGMGGEGMNVPLEEKINDFLSKHGSIAKVIKGYGMTEVCATAVTEYVGAQKVGSVGIPFVKNNVMIFDTENQVELKCGEVGEICLQCESMMFGYNDNQAEMEMLIKKHSDGSEWIHTGDLGYMDEDGYIFIEGRMKRMIMTIHEGVVYKIFPAQTETVLNKNDIVHESCIVKLDKGNDIGIKAVIVKEDKAYNNEKLIKELIDACQGELSVYQIPEKFVFLDEFPRTAAGKIDYRALEMRR
ncbi:MAG: acyl--CoA ligase [Lachnospiraceae bacterium]|nr:acyl--CoA ligase [Lachnospiraceae bacterium]